MDALDRRRRMRLGCDAFNRGAFFEAHEVWESVWVATDGPGRASIQGL
ncbi:MAG: DUF309 domain-containing protein, partial [Polyangiaceae bacterium]|nr:DUF309 domain-containing protein [Polyangiaceae bacterium]